jgi:hypothetical protein
MRKYLFALGAVVLTCTGYLSACSSSDDSAGSTTDGGSDASSDTSVTPDTGTVDSGQDAGPCIDCFQVIQDGPFNVCTNNGPPSSADIFAALAACECEADGGCAAPCASNCADPTVAPSNDCITCLPVNCGAQQTACVNDNGSDSGTVTDAGDGGDGGDGG